MSVATKKKLTLGEIGRAYKRLAKLGWTPCVGAYCRKIDQKACPLAALAFASYKTFPKEPDHVNSHARVKSVYGVSDTFTEAFVNGVDFPFSQVYRQDWQTNKQYKDALRGFKLGVKAGNKYVRGV